MQTNRKEEIEKILKQQCTFGEDEKLKQFIEKRRKNLPDNEIYNNAYTGEQNQGMHQKQNFHVINQGIEDDLDHISINFFSKRLDTSSDQYPPQQSQNSSSTNNYDSYSQNCPLSSNLLYHQENQYLNEIIKEQEDQNEINERNEIIEKIKSLCINQKMFDNFMKVIQQYESNENQEQCNQSDNLQIQEISNEQSKIFIQNLKEQDIEFLNKLQCFNMRNVFERLTQNCQQKKENKRYAQNSQSSNQDSYHQNESAIKCSNTLYQDSLYRKQRQKQVLQIIQQKQRNQQRKSVELNQKSNMLAYKKLDRDIDKAFQIILEENKQSGNRNDLDQIQNQNDIFLQQLSILDAAKIFHILHIFSNQQIIKANKYETYQHCRNQKQMQFLLKVWSLLTFQTNDNNQQLEEQIRNNKFNVPVRIFQDFIKLIFDPYQKSSSDCQISNERIQLIVKFLKQIKQINNQKLDLTEEDLKSKVTNILKEIRELSGNFSSFKMNKNSIQVPSTSEMKMVVEINKDLTFKPQINKLSEQIDQKTIQSALIDQSLEHKNQQYGIIKPRLNQQMFNNYQNVHHSQLSSIHLAENPIRIQMQSQRQLLQGKIVRQSSIKQDCQNTCQNIEANNQNLTLQQRFQIRYQLLMSKKRMRDIKVEERKKQKEMKEIENITFQPSINRINSFNQLKRDGSRLEIQFDVDSNEEHQKGDNKQFNKGQSNFLQKSNSYFVEEQEIHQRLIQWGKSLNKNKQFQIQYNQQIQQEKELEKCTFQPEFITKKNRPTSKQNINNSIIPQGFEKFIQRQQKANEMKIEKKEIFDNLGYISKQKCQKMQRKSVSRNENLLSNKENQKQNLTCKNIENDTILLDFSNKMQQINNQTNPQNILNSRKNSCYQISSRQFKNYQIELQMNGNQKQSFAYKNGEQSDLSEFCKNNKIGNETRDILNNVVESLITDQDSQKQAFILC